MMVRIAVTEDEIAGCFAVMRELRPGLKSVEEFVARVKAQQGQGFALAYLEDAGEVVSVTGFRVQEMLSSGRTLYVDDLVTGEVFRSKGYGKGMVEWLIAYAREQGCDTFSLDSGTHRREAHAFYFREGMRVSSFHFELSLRS
jgi:GNAT superfamily N-acetyltransferase